MVSDKTESNDVSKYIQGLQRSQNATLKKFAMVARPVFKMPFL